MIVALVPGGISRTTRPSELALRRSAVCSAAAGILAAIILTVGALASHAAPPKLDYLFPAGVSRGQTTQVTAAGAFESWPVKCWTDSSGVEVIAGEEKGQLSIAVAEDAVGGICWLRLFDDQGATHLRPLAIGSLREMQEEEPNDSPGEPQRIDPPAIMNGKLAKRGDVDTFLVELQQGQTFIAALQANELIGSPLDGVLQIADRRGFVLAQNNDARGLDPMIVFEVPADGEYLVRAFAFPAQPNSTIDFAGAENYVYRLTLTTGPFLDHAMPSAVQRGVAANVTMAGWNLSPAEQVLAVPAQTATEMQRIALASRSAAGLAELSIADYSVAVEQADLPPAMPQKIEIPSVVGGKLTAAKEADVYRFAATKGQKLSLSVEARGLGLPLDAVLEVVDGGGKVLAENDDVSRTERDARLSFTAPADGEFLARIRDLHGRGGMRFAYCLTIAPERPGFELTLAAGEFVARVGEPLEIPVKIDREKGSVEEIEITALALPPGVSVEAAKSQGKGDSMKQVTLRITATDNAESGPFLIVGHAAGEAPRSVFASFTYDDLPWPHRRAWLTVRPAE